MECSVLSFRGAEGRDEILVVAFDYPRVIVNCAVLRMLIVIERLEERLRTCVNSLALIILDPNQHPSDLHRPAWHATQPVEIVAYRRFVTENRENKALGLTLSRVWSQMKGILDQAGGNRLSPHCPGIQFFICGQVAPTPDRSLWCPDHGCCVRV